jgi:predicted metal-dependent phosphoesterase TrpH
MSIDLHIHSLFSDGTHTPTELIKLAQKNRLSAISITDHDTVAGVQEALSASFNTGIEVIPGIELSVVFNDEHFHLLGYFFDYNDRALHEKLLVLQSARDQRNRKILQKLHLHGINICEEDIQAISHTGQTGRPHIAKALCQKGVVKTFDEAFERYLKKGACAYVPRFVFSAAEAINMLKNTGGLTILAHPAQIAPSFIEKQTLVGKLVDLGLDGIEVYYPTHTPKIRKNLKKIAKRYDMVISGGSDYHGHVRPGTGLAGQSNVFVPPELLHDMRERYKKLKDESLDNIHNQHLA